MGGCSTGRSTQKYSSGGGGADLSSILAAHGDMIYADSNIEAANVSIGQTVGTCSDCYITRWKRGVASCIREVRERLVI